MEKMRYALNEYLQLLTSHQLVTGCDITQEQHPIPVAYVSCNSMDIKENTLFICKGVHFKEQFLKDAVDKGAICYMSEKKYDGCNVPCIIVKDIRKAMATATDFYYHQVWKKLNLVGITGTKGKSTTTYFVKYILDEYLKSKKKPLSGVISSIDTFDGVSHIESHITTPESIDLHKHFNNAVESGMDYMEMEVSSQALKYDRVLGVHFDVGCFLNIGYDHISDIEHKDFNDYFYAKLSMFSQCKIACVNLNTEHLDEVLEAAKNAQTLITFGLEKEDADVYGYQVVKENNDILFRVRTERYDREFRLTMPGLFNVQNALAAIAICEALNIPEQYIYVGLMKARVSGRMEVYSNTNNKVIVIVDYAHNRLSFEKLFQSVKEEYPNRKIVTVFGCPGNKAFDRRKDLGEISGKYSNKVIITEEDPGEEPVLAISKEIALHVKAQGCDYSISPDRGQAIEMAIMGAVEESVILITGKGNETRQKRGTAYIDCPSDVVYTKEFLSKYDVENHLDSAEKINSFISLLPQLKSFSGQTVLVKYGGSALEDEVLIKTMLQDIATLQMVGVRVVVVHGGGKNITAWIDKMGIETTFENGYRITDETTMEVAEMVLSGSVNKHIVQALEGLDVPAVGISGKDGGLLSAQPKLVGGKSIGLVGEIVKVNPTVINTLLDGGYTPVISPIGKDNKGNTYNINADDAAYGIAQAMKVDKLIFLTNVDGILVDGSNESTIIRKMDLKRAKELIADGFVGGGMIPKLENCIKAIENHVKKVVILDGRVPHTILLECMQQDNYGTTIVE